MNLMELLRRRSSAHAFAESAISDAELRHLAQAAILAPSAFHLQNGRFTAVCSPEAKQALCEAAFRQLKILQAAAVFISCPIPITPTGTASSPNSTRRRWRCEGLRIVRESGSLKLSGCL